MKKRSSKDSIPGKRAPQRTCVACRAVKDKRQLIRLVRTAENTVEIDLSGKKPGRGVYLCPVSECWRAGVEDKRLEHALRIVLAPENREHLTGYGKGLGVGNSGIKGEHRGRGK